MPPTAAIAGLAGEPSGPSADDSRLLDAVLDGVGEGLWLETAERALVNPVGRRLLALPEHGEARVADIPVFRADGSPVPEEEHPSLVARRTGRPTHFTLRVRRFDGVERWINGTASPVAGDRDGVVVVFRDVTEEHERSLVDRQILREGFRLLPLATCVTDTATNVVVECNDAFTALTGFERAEACGQQPPFPWWAEGAPAVDVGTDEPNRFEYLFRHRSGRLIPVEVLRFRVSTPTGGGVVVAMFSDLSDRRDLEQQLVQSGKLAAIGELAAGVAHEINNPLFAILGLVEFLLRDAEEGTKAHERLVLIQQTGNEIKDIVRALLDFARERSDERVVVPLAELARQTIDLVRRTSANRGVVIEERYDEGALVEGAPGQLKQVFLNLVANARHAMPDGGTLTVAVERLGDQVVATFTDTGVGMPPEVAERVFEPFFTTKRGTGGTGLGLSVSHGIVTGHGGTIDVVSEPGRGTTFTVRIPAAGGQA